jgi:hypothetical protein
VNATAAIVVARLRAERRGIALACAGAAVVGFVAPHSAFAPSLVCGLLGMALALEQGPGRRVHLDVCERGAPLFGRELARAKAAVPCAAAALTLAVYWSAQTASGALPPLDVAIETFASVSATTLAALSASIRTGSSRMLYLAIACATTAAALLLAELSIAAEVAFCAFASFFALRQYGEALARYDPV